MSIQVFCPEFELVFVGGWVLRVLTIFCILISHQIIYKYFLPFHVEFHFHIFIVFWCTKLRHFHKVLLSVLFTFAFVFYSEIIARCNVVKFCPVFSCRSIIVLGLTFRSLIHLEFVFYKWFWKGPILIFWMWISSFPKSLVEMTALFPFSEVLAQFLKISEQIFRYGGFTSELSILSHWSICLSWCQYHAIFDYCSFTVSKFWGQKVWVLQLSRLF